MKKDLILEEDIENVVRKTDWSVFKNCAFLVTGATGLIGSQVVKVLSRAESETDNGMKIYALARSAVKAEEIFEGYNNINFIFQDICKKIDINERIHHIIHCAGMTGSLDFVNKPVDVIKTGVLGTQAVLEFAAENSVQSMVFLSTMEIYGNPDENSGKISEDRILPLDHMKVRNCYPESKKLIENMCVSYACQYGVPVKIARLTQTFGAGADYNDKRVFAEFARSIIEKKNIVLHTKGETVRNYCYVSDAVSALLAILIKGENAQAYNVANAETTISIKDMAELAAELSGGEISVEYDILDDISKAGYAPKLIMDLDTTKLEALGWKAEYDLKTMFMRMIKSMKSRL